MAPIVTVAMLDTFRYTNIFIKLLFGKKWASYKSFLYNHSTTTNTSRDGNKNKGAGIKETKMMNFESKE